LPPYNDSGYHGQHKRTKDKAAGPIAKKLFDGPHH
jgi:hypothetical protein